MNSVSVVIVVVLLPLPSFCSVVMETLLLATVVFEPPLAVMQGGVESRGAEREKEQEREKEREKKKE